MRARIVVVLAVLSPVLAIGQTDARPLPEAVAFADAAGIEVRVPRPGLCTDNGAMVAALGAEVVRRGIGPSSLDLPVDSGLPVTTVVV